MRLTLTGQTTEHCRVLCGTCPLWHHVMERSQCPCPDHCVSVNWIGCGEGWGGRGNRQTEGGWGKTDRQREGERWAAGETVLEYTGEQRDGHRERDRERRPCSVMLYMLPLDSDTLQLFQHC